MLFAVAGPWNKLSSNWASKEPLQSISSIVTRLPERSPIANTGNRATETEKNRLLSKSRIYSKLTSPATIHQTLVQKYKSEVTNPYLTRRLESWNKSLIAQVPDTDTFDLIAQLSSTLRYWGVCLWTEKGSQSNADAYFGGLLFRTSCKMATYLHKFRRKKIKVTRTTLTIVEVNPCDYYWTRLAIYSWKFWFIHITHLMLLRKYSNKKIVWMLKDSRRDLGVNTSSLPICPQVTGEFSEMAAVCQGLSTG